MIQISIDEILKQAKKKKKISTIPTNPIGQIDTMKKLFSKDKKMLEVISMYEMFRKIEELRKEKIGEFRKNVNLKIQYQGKEINVNLEKLKEYADLIEHFVDTTKKYIAK